MHGLSRQKSKVCQLIQKPLNWSKNTDLSKFKMNVDPAEIDKFSQLASRWWDQEGDFKPLHQINPLRLDYIQRFTPVKDQAILDIGCGGGILSEGLTQLGGHVTGIDLAKAPIAVAKIHAKEAQLEIDYQLISAEELAKKCPQRFDIITCLEVLEHVPDPASVIEAIATMIKPNGHIFLGTINRNLKAFLMAIVGAEYILGLLPKGVHHYEKFIKPQEMTTWLRQKGLTPQDAIGLHYNPLTQKFKLGPGTDVNYWMYATP